jgi:hypothetical protein
MALTSMRRVCAAAALALLASCGDGLPTRQLTPADVEGMGPGNATGTLFSGTYVLTSGGLDACRCRVGGCDAFSSQLGGITTVVQVDGQLTLNGNCTGGVDADGKLWCGGKVEPPQGGVVLGINEGEFLLDAGKPIGLEATQEETVTATIDGRALDCDLRAHAVARLAAQ